MALKPSKIMSWQFTKDLAASRMNRDNYAQWKKNESEAERRAATYKEKK